MQRVVALAGAPIDYYTSDKGDVEGSELLFVIALAF